MTNDFIIKNSTQIKKNINTNKSIENSIIYKLFDNEINAIKEVIDIICNDNKNHNILILSLFEISTTTCMLFLCMR